MRLHFLPFLILWFGSGSAFLSQLCSSSREFAVDNCTACPTLDHTRGDVLMAVCEKQAAGTGNGKAYACRCIDYPDYGSTLPLVYYPRVEGNVTRCASSWATAPQLYTALVVVCGCAMLYAATHLMYIIVLSGMFSCKQPRCTKTSASALLYCMSRLCWISMFLWTIVAQGEVDIGNAWLGYHVNWILIGVTFDLGAALLYTSISDLAFGGDDVAGWRRCINITFWTLAITSSLLITFQVFAPLAGADPSLTDAAYGILYAVRFCAFLFSCVAIAIAHYKMRSVVLAIKKISGEKTKPALVIKMDEFCGAICRYWYPQMAITLFSIALLLYSKLSRRCLGNSAVSPMAYWIYHFQYVFFVGGVNGGLFACLLEGKPVPTFPGCLCRRGRKKSQSLGLQFTSTLGKALALLTKHGLETKRQKEFPVEVAMESLLSTSPLMVAAAPDMDVMSCVEHFLERCTDDEGKMSPKFDEMSFATIQRGGWKQHVLTTADIPILRERAKKCLQWAQDPNRDPIENTTVDEAAAIQLYTQHSCLYPMLNNALRDHTHPENLKAFLPYLKLLLKGLNKLPLLRTKVYRGLDVDLHEEYNQLQGRTFRWWAFSSTSLSEKQSKVFFGRTGASTLFKIDAIGVDISAFSAYPESEVLLLPGTCLVVEPGVMVKDNCWEFQASVWDAAQQELQQHQQHSEANNDEGGSEERPASTLPDRDDSGESTQYFQYTDLPHPGWEEVVYSMKTSYVPDGNVMMARSASDVNPEGGKHLGRERSSDANPEGGTHLGRERPSDVNPEGGNRLPA